MSKQKTICRRLFVALLLLFIMQVLLLPAVISATYATKSVKPEHIITYTPGKLSWDENTETDSSGAARLFLFDSAYENGSGSVTVRDLPCRDYTVEQVGSWSWRYKDSSQTVSVKKGVDNTVTFSKAAAEQYRLNGNSAPVQNRRQGVTLS